MGNHNVLGYDRISTSFVKSFLRHLIIEGTKRWGGFMAIGGHISMTQTDWHWIMETAIMASLDGLLIFVLYLEWNEHRREK